MIRYILSAILSISTFAFASEYRVAVEGAYPPFSEISDKGQLIGFDVEIASAICSEMKVKCKLMSQDWDGMIPALISKKFDFIVSSMSITKERQKAVNFSVPYYKTTISMFANESNKLPPLENKSEKLKIGVQKSTISEQFVREKFPKAEVVLYDQFYQLVMDINSSRIDYASADTLSLASNNKIIKENKIKVFPENYTMKEGSSIAVAARKEDTKLIKEINSAIDAIIKQGIYKKISMKYFGIDLSKDL